MASPSTLSQAARPPRRSAGLFPLDQTLVTVTVGPHTRPFSIHKHLLSLHSDYFRQSFEEGQDQFDFRDVFSDTFALFQWWLYAQASRSNEFDAPLEGTLTREQAGSMGKGRIYVLRNGAREHNQIKEMYTQMTGLSQSRGLEILRQKTVPDWISNKDFDPEKINSIPYLTVFSRLYKFATEYDIRQLRDDILTVLVTHARQGDLAVPTPRDTEWIIEKLPLQSKLITYWIDFIAVSGWKAADERLHAMPNQILVKIIEKMSHIRDKPAHYEDYISDCCNYHEHSNSEAINCHASYSYDGPFYAGFFRAGLASSRWGRKKSRGDATDLGEPHGEGEQPVSEAGPEPGIGPGAEDQEPQHEPEHEPEPAIKTEEAQEEPPRKRSRGYRGGRGRKR